MLAFRENIFRQKQKKMLMFHFLKVKGSLTCKFRNYSRKGVINTEGMIT